jgi:hypothetical protein
VFFVVRESFVRDATHPKVQQDPDLWNRGGALAR